MPKYARVSEHTMKIFMDFTDLVEQLSIDEAFLDVTGSLRLHGSGPEIARKIKARIYHELGLTASVGVATNKFLAKIASDLEKPDGLVVVEPGLEQEFLRPLPVRCLWGVGKKTEAALRGFGLERIGQLVEVDREEMVRRFGRTGDHLWQLARGVDDREVNPEEGYKSIGHEITFEHDTEDAGVLHATLLHLTEKVAQRLRANRACGRTVTVKLRHSDFSTATRRTTLKSPVDTSEKIFPVALKLLQSLHRRGKVRLIGVYAGNLTCEERPDQLSLFGTISERDRRLAEVLDSITQRFGDKAITRATLIPKRKRKEREPEEA